MEYKISIVQKEELKEIAKIHKRIFSDHFLGQLPVFLIQKFYESFHKEEVLKESKVIFLESV